MRVVGIGCVPIGTVSTPALTAEASPQVILFSEHPTPVLDVVINSCNKKNLRLLFVHQFPPPPQAIPEDCGHVIAQTIEPRLTSKTDQIAPASSHEPRERQDHFRGFAGSDLVPRSSPASGPLGNTTWTSNPSTITERGTRTECEHRRPQRNPEAQRSMTTLPGSVSRISASTSRP